MLINDNKEINIRKLAYDLFSLPFHITLSIATDLKLAKSKDNKLSDMKQCGLLLKRAKNNNCLEQLKNRVDQEINK